MNKERALRAAGLALGVSIVVALAAAGRVPGGERALGLDLTVASGPTGELGLSPSGPFLRAAGLRAGETARGSVEISNQTGARLRITPLFEPSDRTLADLLHLELRVANRLLASGTLADALTATKPFSLGAGEKVQLTVQLGLPRSAGDRADARVLGVNLVWKVEVAP